MNFDFDNFKKKFVKTARKAKDTSLSMVEITKCKYKLVEIKADIDDKFIQIGKLVYKNVDSEEADKKIETLCNEISELKSRAEDIQNIIDDNLNKKQCPECDAKADKSFTFCPKCGYNFDE